MISVPEHLSVYLKTTETCNLNCDHCFTSGSRGAKVFFQPARVIDFFARLRATYPRLSSLRIMFHGGEPMLARVEDLYRVHQGILEIFPEVRFGMQTNLVYELSAEKLSFFDKVLLRDGFGTSWDYDIRFGSSAQDPSQRRSLRQKHVEIWEHNVRQLVARGHYLTMIVSITDGLVKEKEPIDVIRYAASLGFKHILFERITDDGNARRNQQIRPSNDALDLWLHRMFRQTLEYRLDLEIGNMLLTEIAEAFLNRQHVGNRCRTCEQNLLTINADGTLAGCPNTAPLDHWGHIDWPIQQSFGAAKRATAIGKEIAGRNPICYTCPAFEICNSDCNKLPWDERDTVCGAPRSIWKEMMSRRDIEQYRLLLAPPRPLAAPHGT